MKIIKSFAIAASFAMLAACGGGAENNTAETTDANMTATDNLTIDANNVTVLNEGGMDMNATTDMNITDMNATGTTDANMTTNNAM